MSKPYNKMKIPELKALLRENGLPVSGNKKVLIDRLSNNLNQLSDQELREIARRGDLIDPIREEVKLKKEKVVREKGCRINIYMDGKFTTECIGENVYINSGKDERDFNVSPTLSRASSYASTIPMAKKDWADDLESEDSNSTATTNYVSKKAWNLRSRDRDGNLIFPDDSRSPSENDEDYSNDEERKYETVQHYLQNSSPLPYGVNLPIPRLTSQEARELYRRYREDN